MENTIDNADTFLRQQENYVPPAVFEMVKKRLVAYASACYAPSSIGEDEKNRIVQEVIEMHPYKVPGKPHTYCDYNQGWEDACDILDQHLTEWAISRLSERKIVLPSDIDNPYEGDLKRLTLSDGFEQGWKAHERSVKELNGIN